MERVTRAFLMFPLSTEACPAVVMWPSFAATIESRYVTFLILQATSHLDAVATQQFETLISHQQASVVWSISFKCCRL
jgi:hypothetical protein